MAGEEFFALGKCSGRCLWRLDPSTGVVLDEKQIPGNPSTAMGLTHDGALLWTIEQSGLFPDTTTSVHPASALDMPVGLTGFDWNPIGIAHAPLTGLIYAVDGFGLYTIDRVSGRATMVHSGFSGVVENDCICSIAVAPNGKAYGMGFLVSGQTRLYEVNLEMGRATLIGSIPFNVPGVYRDIAFDSTGQLWAVWLSLASPHDSGIYKVDISTLTRTLVQQYPPGWIEGIAFGPGTIDHGYCLPKTGASGCEPAITGDGIASPTATIGYVVSASDVRNQRVGMLMLSVNGRAALPFSGGTLCIQPPLVRTMLVNSGGSPTPVDDCSGSWSFDVNSVMSHDQGFVEGTVVTAQWFGRDGPAGTPNNLALSDAWAFTLLP